MSKALITGITGQDGSHLAEFLLSKNYQVYGLVRHTSVEHYPRLLTFRERVTLVPGDLVDATSLARAIADIQPDEVYNLAGMSFVAASWGQPGLTTEVNAVGVLRILEAIRLYCPSLALCRPRPARCLARFASRRNLKRPPSIRAVRTASRKSMPIT